MCCAETSHPAEKQRVSRLHLGNQENGEVREGLLVSSRSTALTAAAWGHEIPFFSPPSPPFGGGSPHHLLSARRKFGPWLSFPQHRTVGLRGGRTLKAIQPHPHRVALPSAHPRPRAPPRPSSHPSPAALSPARSAARRLPAQPAALQPRVMPAERSTAPLQPPRPPRTALTPLRGSHVPQCARLSSAAALAESAKQPRKALPFSATSSCLGTESSSRVPAQPRSALHGIT